VSTIHKDISQDLISGLFTILDGYISIGDTITLTGTSGDASITSCGLSKNAQWRTSLSVTASDFVIVWASYYLAIDVIVTCSGPTLTFKSRLFRGTNYIKATIVNLNGNLNGTISLEGINCSVYKSIPKPAPLTYVYVGNVINDQDGDKDNFRYNGTVQVHVIDESNYRGDKKLAFAILNVIRGLLKPTVASVPSVSPSTLVILKPGSFNDVTEYSDNNISRVKLVDQYDFILE
jgi:hypothetical protein